MKKALRGRPTLKLDLEQIIEAVQRHGQIVRAAVELRCSDGYIHKRQKAAGLTLTVVLEGSPQGKNPPEAQSENKQVVCPICNGQGVIGVHPSGAST